MIFLYGRRRKFVTKELVDNSCPNCGTSRSVSISVFQGYVHLFFIPMFPFLKQGVSECAHCKQVLKEGQMPESLRNEYRSIKSKTRAPLVTYSGLLLIALFIGTAAISGEMFQRRDAERLLKPQIGDIYELKISDHKYTVYKVCRVANDSVYLYPGTAYTVNLSGLNKLVKQSSYEDETEGYSIAELKQMLEERQIIGVDRK